MLVQKVYRSFHFCRLFVFGSIISILICNYVSNTSFRSGLFLEEPPASVESRERGLEWHCW